MPTAPNAAFPHRQVGKLIVATSEADVATLERYRALARANGAGELPWLSAAEVGDLEPDVTCVRAILAPRTGIVDSHALMLALLGDLQAAGGQVAYRSPLLRALASSEGFTLHVGGDEPATLDCAVARELRRPGRAGRGARDRTARRDRICRRRATPRATTTA